MSAVPVFGKPCKFAVWRLSFSVASYDLYTVPDGAVMAATIVVQRLYRPDSGIAICCMHDQKSLVLCVSAVGRYS